MITVRSLATGDSSESKSKGKTASPVSEISVQTLSSKHLELGQDYSIQFSVFFPSL